jgi:Amt family ammonium transporter
MDNVKMTKVEIITRQNKLEELKEALNEIGITGMTVTNVLGCGLQKGRTEIYRGVKEDIQLLPKVRIEMVISKIPVKTVIDVAKKALYTGNIGDGKIFIYDVSHVERIRTDETDYDALQDEE